MLLNCPECHKPLKVPDNAVGKRARCSACRHKFVIPDPAAMMDETIAGWMVEDLEQLQELKAKHQSLYRQLEMERAPKPAPDKASRPSGEQETGAR